MSLADACDLSRVELICIEAESWLVLQSSPRCPYSDAQSQHRQAKENDSSD